MNERQVLIEVCVASVDSAVAAENAGAARIELNSALELDGLTPSAGVVKRVVESLKIPVIAMARPRAGGFLYTGDQWQTLLADAEWLLAHGASGIAFGALDDAGKIDTERCRQMRQLTGNRELVFHKAFDQVSDPVDALERLIDVGVDRVMTSGLAATAMDGAAVIGQLVQQAGDRIEVLPAGRISASNVSALVDWTGATQVHGSFQGSGRGDSDQQFREIQAVIKAVK